MVSVWKPESFHSEAPEEKLLLSDPERGVMNMKFFRCLTALLLSVALLLLIPGCGSSANIAKLLSVSIYPDTPTLSVGSTLQFSATGLYTTGSTNDLTSSAQWSSSNGAVATVNSSGLVTAIAAGTTTIKASSGGFEDSTTLTVVQSGVFNMYSSRTTFGSPSGVAVDAFSNYSGTHNVYVADTTNNLLRVFNASGTSLTSWSTTGEPHGVAIDRQHNLYVIDVTNSLLRKYNSSGTLVSSWATTGSPSGVAVDVSFNVYVTDALNKQIVKYDSAGTRTLFCATNWVPFGIAVAQSGTLFVSDITNNEVHTYDTGGNETGTPLSIAGVAYGIAVDPSGSYLYVADYTHSQTLRYQLGVSGYSTLLSGFSPYGVALDPVVSSIYVTDVTNDSLHKSALSQ